jgi:formamidopyrimidine-DNA glycosylase
VPELPEVETIVRGLRRAILGATIDHVQVLWPGVVADPSVSDFCEQLCGARVTSVRRRAKYLCIQVPPRWLIVHLRMTGRMLYRPNGDASLEADKHVHLVIHLASGGHVYYRDVRKFGRFWLRDDPESLLEGLGPEPLAPGFTGQVFRAMLWSHHRQLKPALLDQKFLAGLGNIYVDEVLWHARLHPLRHTDELTSDEAGRLYAAILDVLTDAVEHKGTTLRDYSTVDGNIGQHQFALVAYGRDGEPCLRCGCPIERVVVGQRGTHYCPVCQQAPLGSV